MENEQKIKYIHLLWGHDLKFTGPLLELLNDKDNNINIDKHLFVTPYESVYECIKHFPNVILDNSNENLYEKYYIPGRWVITHGYNSKMDFFKIKKKILNRTIFRTWGGTFNFRWDNNKSFFSNLISYFFSFLYKNRIKQLAAIGIANFVDEFDIRKSIKNVPLYRLSYSDKNRYDSLVQIKKCIEHNKTVRVLVGHRGTRDNNHLDIINKLEKFKNIIDIYIPLSYGDKDYIEKLTYTFENNYKDYNLHIIKDFYQFEDYSKFLSTIDIAIFDGKDSYALGNISSLLFFGKKIFLSRKSLIAQAFKIKNVPYSFIEKLVNMTFDQFSKPVMYTDSAIQHFIISSYAEAVSNWKHLFIDYN